MKTPTEAQRLRAKQKRLRAEVLEQQERARRAERECAEWKARFDTLLAKSKTIGAQS